MLEMTGIRTPSDRRPVMSAKKAAAKTPPRPRGRPVSLAKRRAILEAGIAEFGTSGYRDASMDAIAARAGVSKRTLYNHFPSKAILFRALVADLKKKITLSSTIEYRRDVPLRQQLRQFAQESIKLMRDPDNLRFSRAVVAEHMLSPALVEAALGDYWKDEYGFAAWVDAARRDGRLKVKDAVRASHIFASIVRGVIFWPALLGRHHFESRNLNAAINEAVDMFLAFYADATER